MTRITNSTGVEHMATDTDNQVLELNSKIAVLDSVIASGITGIARQKLISERTELYNARNRLPLRRSA